MFIGNAQIRFRPPAFAKVLREQGKVTQEVLDEALQIRAKENKYLGQILCDLGHVSAADIETALTLPVRRADRVREKSPAVRAVRRRGPLKNKGTKMVPGSPDRLVPPPARIKEWTPVPARPIARISRRPDLSAPFAVTLITGLLSAGLFLSGVVQHDVPLGRVFHLALVDPFGVMALALLAAAGVMALIGDV
jgi:hypothetical protein